VSGPVWIFGYGSLVWRPDFPFAERRPAWIEGFARRFWQGSTDHRGRPGAPGRVVTLVPHAGARCTGLAYRLDPSHQAGVLADLDHRERGGYRRLRVAIELATGRVPGLLYQAREDNPNYLGPASLAAIATQVAGAHGPSGSNREYVERLARALRELGAEDDHVFGVKERIDPPGDQSGD